MSKGKFWAGWVISGLVALFLLLDGVMKLFKPSFVVEGTVRLGYSESAIVPIGIVLVVCTLLYLIPATTILGAILLTGYLGGAIATHVRTNEGAFPIVFALTFGVLVWAGLYLRDVDVQKLIPFRKSGDV